jgi:hypothetical protein
MRIKLSPMRADSTLSIERSGDSIRLNGVLLDFTQLEDGATLPAEDWQQESVVEWTDTTHTALRYRNTRFITAHVAAKGADGKVFLHAVHLASDRETDGSWGSLYGHIMWSDWMAEKNVNEDPPSP